MIWLKMAKNWQQQKSSRHPTHTTAIYIRFQHVGHKKGVLKLRNSYIQFDACVDAVSYNFGLFLT